MLARALQLCWSNWRFKTQILCLQSLLQISTITILSSIIYVAYQEIMNQYVSISLDQEKLLFLRNLDIVMKHQLLHSHYVINRAKLHLLKFDGLYRFQLMHEIQLPVQTASLAQETPDDRFILDQTYCYDYFGDKALPLTDSDFSLASLTSLLTETIPIQDSELGLIMTSLNPRKFFSMWPGAPILDGYDPHKRVWYLNHMNQIANGNYQPTYFSPPYSHWAWKIKIITQTASLSSLDGDLVGILGTHLNFTFFQDMFEHFSQLQFLMTNRDGVLFLNSRSGNISDFILNETSSGVDLETFQQIINMIDRKNATSNCSMDFGPQVLCRYDNYTKSDAIYYSQQIIAPHIILIMQNSIHNSKSDLRQVYDDQIQISSELRSKFTQQISLIFYGGLGLILFTIMTSFCIIYPILSNINNLLCVMITNIYKDEPNFRIRYAKQCYMVIKINKANNQLERLQLAIKSLLYNLEKKASAKTRDCQLIESFTYPKCYSERDQFVDYLKESANSCQSEHSTFWRTNMMAFDLLKCQKIQVKVSEPSANDSIETFCIKDNRKDKHDDYSYQSVNPT